MTIGIVGALLRQFGGGGGGSAPASPTLSYTIGESGEVTFTIASGDTSAINYLYLLSPFSDAWSSEENRSGNGTIVTTLEAGRHFAYVKSVFGGESVSNVVVFRIDGNMNEILDHSPADILRHYLIGEIVGTLPSLADDWPIYCASEPNLPDNCITTYDTSGKLDGRIMVEGAMQEHYGVQIRIRCSDPVTGWQKAKEISRKVDIIYRETVLIDSAQYLIHSVTRTGGILSLGKDVPNGRRNLFTINMLIDITQES